MLKFTVHNFYPGVTLVVSGEESILFGVPNDAFKATKQYCNDHKLPFPRTLVAPPKMVVLGTPQFNPEFFSRFSLCLRRGFQATARRRTSSTRDAQRQRRCIEEAGG